MRARMRAETGIGIQVVRITLCSSRVISRETKGVEILGCGDNRVKAIIMAVGW